MRPLSDPGPKPVLSVGDRPLVERASDAAVEGGAEELVVVVGYGGERGGRHVEGRFGGRPVDYARTSVSRPSIRPERP